MTERLPVFIDPLGLVKKRAELRGSVALTEMPRVAELLMATQGDASVVLQFYRDAGLAVVEGSVVAQLTLQCQSCMEPVIWPVHAQVKLGMVATLDEANLLPETHEPWLIGGDPQVRLLDIVEDELILAIPIIPRHSQCNESRREAETLRLNEFVTPQADAPERRNPFGVLAVLKKH